MSWFVVSDVHGCYDELMNTLSSAGFDSKNPDHILVVCGDLFDRGPKSPEVYKFVRSLPDNRFVWVKGNHEDLLNDCVIEMYKGMYISEHHYTNRTLNTIEQFTGKVYSPRKLDEAVEIVEMMKPILAYIKEKCVNYYVILNKIICTHGWLPVDRVDFSKSNWQEETDKLGDQIWKDCRWRNGQQMWNNVNNRPKNRTVICGHVTCSFGNNAYHGMSTQWPDERDFMFNKYFYPFIDDGIIAIDGCTNYSHILNCIKIPNDGNVQAYSERYILKDGK